MGKRIFEVAKELGIKASEVVDVLAKNNIKKGNFNNVDDNDMAIIHKHFGKGGQGGNKAGAKPGVSSAARSEAANISKVEKEPVAGKNFTTSTKAESKPEVIKPVAAPKVDVKPEFTASKPVVASNPAAGKQETSSVSNGSKPVVSDHRVDSHVETAGGPFNNAKQAGYQSRSQQDGYQNRSQQGGYQNRSQQGGYQNRSQQGGYQNRSQQGGQSGYQNRSQQGGYQNRSQQGGQGGYQNRSQQGGYQNRSQQGGQGGYQNRSQQGGYQNRSQQGGYQNREQGNRAGGGIFVGPRGQRPGQFERPQGGQGGYQNRFQQGGQGGSNGNRFQNHSQGGRPQGGFKKDHVPGSQSQSRFQNSRPAKPAHKGNAGLEDLDIPRGKESREKYNKKREKQSVKGSYATRDSRPNRSTNHMGRNNKRPQGKMEHRIEQPQVDIIRPTSVKVGESINVKDFAQLIKREVSEVIKSLFLLGVMVTINQDIDFDTAVLVGTEFDVDVQPLPPEEDPTEVPEIDDDPALRTLRPPVVTVMGHVDHGKTSLLDAIRKSNITAREAGGITQHIGAYMVNLSGKKIVFLDTPGHEAFTAMRARGAQCTDIAVLVVAADDGVMPQTIEAINHAKAAKVPIIVAINKIDKPGANPEHVKEELSKLELIPEDWGGDVIMVPVSARQKTGIKDLLENILLVAEVQELKANANLPARGTIIEAQLDKGRGPVATVLIQRGTLRVGDNIIAGTTYGKVRAMVNDRGEKVKKAGPSMPVEVLGLNEVPMAGDILDSTDEKTARSVAEKRIAKKKAEEVKQNAKVSLDDLFKRIQEGELKELDIVVKADVQGTIEALRTSLENIKNEEVKVVVVHSGVGAITETDVMLAAAANALIIGFNVRPDANARKLIEKEKVDVRTYRVIYDAINDVEAAIKGMLAPKFKENVIGRVEVRQIIPINKILIAGCYVTEGKVTNNAKIRIVRDGIVISEDDMESLRRFKDDVKEVTSGYECGITLAKFHDIKEGDVFEAYIMEEVAVE
jgi:translation initiation factor IF-2